LEDWEDGPVGAGNADHRDYDVEHYARHLHNAFASRFPSAFTPTDYEAVFADPDQMSLFMPTIATIRTVLEQKPEAKADTF
jgi:hypothetical protein